MTHMKSGMKLGVMRLSVVGNSFPINCCTCQPQNKLIHIEYTKTKYHMEDL